MASKFQLLPFLLTRQAAKDLDDSSKRNMLPMLAGLTSGPGVGSALAPVAIAQSSQAKQDRDEADVARASASAKAKELETHLGQVTENTAKVMQAFVGAINQLNSEVGDAEILQTLVDDLSAPMTALGWQPNLLDGELGVDVLIDETLPGADKAAAQLQSKTIGALVQAIDGLKTMQEQQLATVREVIAASPGTSGSSGGSPGAGEGDSSASSKSKKRD